MNDERVPENQQRKTRTGCCWLPILLLLGVLAVVVALPAAGGFLVLGDAVKPVDALVVLSGEEGERVLEAVSLYKEQVGRTIVFTVTDGEDIGEQKTYSQKLMRIAIDAGAPQDAMLLTEGESINTIEEARAVLLLCQKRGIKSIMVITSPYHTRRTKLIFSSIFKETEISVRVHPVENSWYKPWSWFLTEEGWRQTIAEYGSLLYYSLDQP